MRRSRRPGSQTPADVAAPTHEPTPLQETVKPAPPAEATAPSGSAEEANDCGLQSNGSLQDSEVLEMLAPHCNVEEEKRLQQEREAQEQAAAAEKPTIKCSVLDSGRFAALDHLLRQSEAYTSFLAEQMKEYEANLVAEAKRDAQLRAGAAAVDGEPGSASKPGGKRKRGGKAGSADGEGSKKAKPTLTPTQELLPLMRVELRDYQLKGVKWLISLYQNGVNGILADQMGLGKTVQTLGFLSHLHSKGIYGPFMIVGPLSTLTNWVNEFQRFLPAVPVMLYHGTKAEREALRGSLADKTDRATRRALPTHPVIVTSYEIVVADAKFLSRINFRYVVVDEGHRLKNFNCRLIRELRTIPADNKLLLSGTPLQNNLSELWSLLNFLMPDVFGNLADFEAWFDFGSVLGQSGADQEIVAAEQRNKVVSKLHAILKPFMLRRLKTDVDIELPSKREIILYAEMTDTQKKINQQIKDGNLGAALEQESGVLPVGKLNNVLMQLRKNCNHPDLITSSVSQDINYPPPDVLVAQCGKMRLLDALLRKLHAAGHKVLIFSQMVKMLDIIHSYAEELGHRVCRLDGGVSWQDRQAAINAFNSDKETWLFLLSTRAGGLGINLTAADSVIIYDSDWNPHQDMQAMDRCHRIGQIKPVLVFRLATAHSIEGRMLRRAADKMALERLVIRKGAFKEITEGSSEAPASTGLTAAELTALLRGDFRMDDLPQSGVVDDKMLDTLLDRRHMEEGKPPPYPLAGVGYEVVQSIDAKAHAGDAAD